MWWLQSPILTSQPPGLQRFDFPDKTSCEAAFIAITDKVSFTINKKNPIVRYQMATEFGHICLDTTTGKEAE